MGRLIDGEWSTEWYAPDEEGRFVREATRFRDTLSGEPSAKYPVEIGRYHLFVSLACPWAHRTLIMRAMKGLEHVLPVSVVHPRMGEDGWSFDQDAPGATGDRVYGSGFLRELYVKALPNYTGRVTVPVLWDTKTHSIVNNESRMIIRMLDRDLESETQTERDLCPVALEADVDREIDAMYESVNNGVYRAGFAVTQSAYEEAVTELFDALGAYEKRLGGSRYLLGPQLTEADICLFTTLVRFEPVYHFHFKCNLRRLRDFPNLWGYTRDIYQLPEVTPTVDLVHIKRHYFESHPGVNPTRIVPVGPELDLNEPHGRENLGG